MKTNNPFFSIIMPIYRTEQFVESSVRSVLDQSFTDFELICVNDFTDDKAFEICKKFASKDKRIVCLDSDKNLGQALARNKGLEKASGEYILFLDSDDKLELVTLKTIYEMIIDNNPDCVIFGYKNIFEDGSEKEVLGNIKEGLYPNTNFYSHLLKELEHPFISCVGTKAYRREMLVEHNIIFNSNFLYNEDLGFALTAFKHCNSFYYINKPFYLYFRRSAGSTMSSYKPNMFYSVMLARSLYLDLISKDDVVQMSNFYKVVIGGAFDGLKNEKHFKDKSHFNKEITNISNQLFFNETYEFIKKHKKQFPMSKRLFVSSIRRGNKNLLWSFVK